MDKLVLSTNADPEVVVRRVNGDLRLYGWERNEIFAEAEHANSLRTEPSSGPVVLVCESACSLRVPRQARVIVEHVGGDARVKTLEGPLTIGFVGGDLALRRTAEARAGQVNGDLSAKKIDGPLTVERVDGDLSARGVAGDFVAGQVGGDLYLRDAEAGAQARAGGDAVIVMNFASGHAFSFEAGGDILCRVGPGQSARLSLAAGGDVDVDVPGAQVQEVAGQKQVTLGDGAAQVSLRAGGEVSLRQVSADPEAMGEFGDHFGEEFGVMAEEFASQIETQIETQMAEFEKQMAERMASFDGLLGASHVNAEAIAARARRAAERASEKARRKANAAQRKAEAAQRKAESVQRRAERRAEAGSRRKGFSFTLGGPMPPIPPFPPPRPPAPPGEAVSDQERLAILRMVEQGKINVAEAEKLLAALEGKG